MAVLALLAEEPMHVYRMQQLIRERAKDTVVNVASRNSVHQVVDRLVRDGLAVVRDGAIPTGTGRGRTTYGITAAGATTLTAWFDEVLAAPQEEFPTFPAALAFVALLTPDQVATQLARRADALRATLALPGPAVVAAERHLPRVFLLEDEYKVAMAAAELAWLDQVVADLRSGSLTWPAAGIHLPSS